MSTTEPIRNTIELSRFMDYYKTECANHRNYAMIMLGLYSALRISDILNLKWSDIYDFKGRKIKSAVTVKEQKTGKINNFALNNHIQQALSLYLRKKSISADEYVFCQRLHPNKPICRSQAYRLVNGILVYLDEDADKIHIHQQICSFYEDIRKEPAECDYSTQNY